MSPSDFLFKVKRRAPNLRRKNKDKPASSTGSDANPSQPPQQDGSHNPSSSKGTGTNVAQSMLGMCKTALEIVGKAPLPGVEMATILVTKIIAGIEGWPEATDEWNELLDQLRDITATLKVFNGQDSLKPEALAQKGEDEDMIKSAYFQPLYTHLEVLSNQINEVNQRRMDTAKFWRFWNSDKDIKDAKSFKEKLRDATQRIQTCIALHTNATLNDLKKEIEAIAQTFMTMGGEHDLQTVKVVSNLHMNDDTRFMNMGVVSGGRTGNRVQNLDNANNVNMHGRSIFMNMDT